MNTVKLWRTWKDIKFEGESEDYEEVNEGVDYEDQPYTIEEAIEELKGSEGSDNGPMPQYYTFDAEHNLDGSITITTIYVDGTDEQLKAIRKGLK
jgi:hypothetical protein